MPTPVISIIIIIINLLLLLYIITTIYSADLQNERALRQLT